VWTKGGNKLARGRVGGGHEGLSMIGTRPPLSIFGGFFFNDCRKIRVDIGEVAATRCDIETG
jgi:hypothetical protein